MTQSLFRTLMALTGILWVAIFILMPPDLQTIDEFIQASALAAMERGDGFWVQKAASEFTSSDLKAALFVQGPNGFVSQYPSGFTMLALPFWMIGGVRGVFLLNLMAAAGVLAVSYMLVKRLSDAETARIATSILALSTYLVDFSSAFWPHSVAIFFAMTSLYLAAIAVTETGNRAGLWALASGVAVGIGLNMRIDAVLVLPPLLLWVILFARQPIRVAGFGGIGLIPGVAFSSWVNHAKFGTWNPISYGHGGGVTALSSYVAFVALLILIVGFVAMLRSLPDLRKWLAVGVAVAMLVSLVFLSEARELIWSTIRGYYVLGVDISAEKYVGRRISSVDLGGGVVAFFGIYKKALAQSLSWMFLCLPTLFLDRQYRSAKVLAILVCVMVMLPFAIKEFHGGGGNNQRYLILILPFLAYLGARGFLVIGLPQAGTLKTAMIVVLGALVLLEAFFGLVPRIAWPFLQQLVPKFLFFIGFIAISYLLLRGGNRAGRAIWVITWVAFALAGYEGHRLDVARTAQHRTANLDVGNYYARLPSRTLLHSSSLSGGLPLVQRDDIVVALSYYRPNPDWRLIGDALDRGWTVSTTRPWLRTAIAHRFKLIENRMMDVDERGTEYYLMRSRIIPPPPPK